MPPSSGTVATLPNTTIANTSSTATFWAAPENAARRTRQCAEAYQPYSHLTETCFVRNESTISRNGWQALYGLVDYENYVAGAAKMVHSGRKVVSMPELGGDLIGLAHMHRGGGTLHGPVAGVADYPWNSNHYTHFFYRLTKEQPHTLRALSDEVHAAAALTPPPSRDGPAHSLLLRCPTPPRTCTPVAAAADLTITRLRGSFASRPRAGRMIANRCSSLRPSRARGTASSSATAW